MFIKLTENERPFYINVNEIRYFYGEVYGNKRCTLLVLNYGTRIVEELPDQIYKMMKDGGNNEV